MSIDPTPLPGPKTDARIAEEWMGWERNGNWWCKDGLRLYQARPHYAGYWSPSTNPAHAGEARRKAEGSYLDHLPSGTCSAYIDGGEHVRCSYSEVTGDTKKEIKGRAEALAICRAIDEAMKAKEKNDED